MRFPWHGGGYEHTKTWQEMTFWEQIKFIADCIGLVAGVILILLQLQQSSLDLLPQAVLLGRQWQLVLVNFSNTVSR